MAKARSQYLCRQCGAVQSRWMGKCPDCGTWDALEKYTTPREDGEAEHRGVAASWSGAAEPTENAAVTIGHGSAQQSLATARPLPEIEALDVARSPTGIGELDRVLGGGLVPGSVILLGGDPGIGKSTILMQAAGSLARTDQRVLYVSSEESAYQTRLRAERLFAAEPPASLPPGAAANDGETSAALDELYVLADTSLGRIVEQARQVQPKVMVIDSVQMIYKADVAASPGSATQLRRCCTELVYLAKLSGMSIVLIGHVTKEGKLAGPKLLEHLVDAVLSFEGDRHHAHRVVRGIKNRFGTTLEVGLFEMTGRGLIELDDSAMLLHGDESPRSGSIVCPAMHGSRCLLVETQGLTATGFLGSAKRRATGLDSSRLTMLIAVLEKHAGLRLADQDVFASAVGGLKIIEPAADLSICLAIAGAFQQRALPHGYAAVGEVGLGGEVRPATHLAQRIAEAQRLGFTHLVTALPHDRQRATPPQPLEAVSAGDGALRLVHVRNVTDALQLLDPVPSGASPPSGSTVSG